MRHVGDYHMLDKIPTNAFDDILILFNRVSPLGVPGIDALCQLIHETLLMGPYRPVVSDSFSVKGVYDTQQMLVRKLAQRLNAGRNGTVVAALVHVHEPAMPTGKRRAIHDRPRSWLVEIALFEHNTLHLFTGRKSDVDVLRFSSWNFISRIYFQKQRQAYQITDNSVWILMRDYVFIVDIR